MSDREVLQRVVLTTSHRPTGKTRHRRGEELIPPPAQLAIVRYRTDPGYYLLYLDERGEELTDTYHETVEKAMDQADWEFGVKPDEWEPARPDRP